MLRVAPLLSGFSVTIPHKMDIMRYLPGIDRAAAAIGAVNTVVRGKNGFRGSNTDAPGALDAIEQVRRVRGKTVLIIGAGGAARAIAFEAKRRGADITVANRTPDRAAALARDLGVRSVPMEDLPKTAFDVLVNATSVGMVPRTEEMPVPASILRKKLVFDSVYNPPMTRLLAEAKRRGAAIVRGTEMYANQAALQSRLFTGRRLPRGTVKKLLENQFRHSSHK
jgi:shikimate dehydrogenase